MQRGHVVRIERKVSTTCGSGWVDRDRGGSPNVREGVHIFHAESVK